MLQSYVDFFPPWENHQLKSDRFDHSCLLSLPFLIQQVNAMQITPYRQLLAAAGRTFCCILKKLRFTLPVMPSEPRIYFFQISNEPKDGSSSGSE